MLSLLKVDIQSLLRLWGRRVKYIYYAFVIRGAMSQSGTVLGVTGKMCVE